MSKILIEEAKRQDLQTGTVIVAVKYKCSDVSKWLINYCSGDVSDFYEADDDISDELINSSDRKAFDEKRISDFKGFDLKKGDTSLITDVLSVLAEDDIIDFLKFVMQVTLCDKSEAEKFINYSCGKYSYEIYSVQFDFSKIPDEEKYIFRLQAEADISNESIFHKIYRKEFELRGRALKKLVSEMNDAEYNLWREEFIAEKFDRADKEHIIACSYNFGEEGHYVQIMHEDDLEGFKDFIRRNSAVVEKTEKADDTQIKTYIALNAGKN